MMSETGNDNVEFKIPIGGISEFPDFIVSVNYKVSKWDETCPHVVNGVLPIGIIARNEGGFNCTVVCGTCIIDAIKKHTRIFMWFEFKDKEQKEDYLNWLKANGTGVWLL